MPGDACTSLPGLGLQRTSQKKLECYFLLLVKFLQNLKPAVKKALAQVSEREEEDSTQEGEESSNEEDVADENSSDHDKGEEQSIGEVEEKEEVMTVEQAK